jgi:hypothetical protein
VVVVMFRTPFVSIDEAGQLYATDIFPRQKALDTAIHRGLPEIRHFMTRAFEYLAWA